MQIAHKLTLPLALSGFVVLGVATFVSARADVALQEEDVQRDQRIAGQVLASAFHRELKHDTFESALRVVDDANLGQDRVRFRYVSPAAVAATSALPAEARASLARGEPVFRIDHELWGTASTWEPVTLPDGTRGALWLQEPLAVQQESLARIVRTQVGSALALGGLWAVVALGLGALLVGRPMKTLTEQAKLIGSGDLSHPLRIAQHDEIGTLAQEMNRMCEELLQSRRLLEQALTGRAQAEEQLRHADRLNTVGKLASGLAHEVGTPLNVISARARMIEQGEVQGAEAKASATIIVGQTEGISRIIRQLLDFARRTTPSSTHGSLSELTAQTLSMLQPLADRREVRLELKEGARTEGDFDQGQVQQAVTNLVMNALQASPKGASVRVRVGSGDATPPADLGGPATKYLYVRIEDDGQGMAPDLLPRIFEPFFTTKEVGEGTGLGLSVAWGLVRDHHGWIAVDSAPGKGSVFTIHLPAEHRS